MPSPPAGQVETGVPAFVVLAPEALGLANSPSDLHLLPDGRVLVIAQNQMAFGDGMRWETVRAAEGQEPIYRHVAVDPAGRLYTGIDGGLARIDFGSDGRWRATRLSGLPADPPVRATMTSVQVADGQWYWYAGSGAVVRWRPDAAPVTVGSFGSIEQIFQLGESLYISDQASGNLVRVPVAGGAAESVSGTDVSASRTITCVVPFQPGELLVGTALSGLEIFDGRTFRRFTASGVFAQGNRINDLCVVGEGIYAAALDKVGIVFFNRSGEVVQALERSLDHRLARVQQLRYAPTGVLWCLLNEGIARVEFPSPVSYFDPLITSGLSYVQPVRHQGALWLLAEGRTLRGVYDNHRLQRFDEERVPGLYAFTLASVGNHLFAGTDRGLFVRRDDEWVLAGPGLVNARIVKSLPDGGWVYVARGEYGVGRPDGASYQVTRISHSGLGDSYNAVEDGAGVVWVELGTSRVGRIDLPDGQPSLRILTAQDGISDGWVEIFVFEGEPRFHLPSQLFRIDPASGRFVDDRELIERFPQFLTASGRPKPDSRGRYWYSANGAAYAIDPPSPGQRPVSRLVPVGMAPTDYTMEENGIIWMFSNRRLVRYDPNQAEPATDAGRALITSVQFATSNRHLCSPGEALPPVPYSDNSVFFHFAAPANPFAAPVTFETLLEGSGSRWVSTGDVGYVGYSRLEEGSYVFRVRPVSAAGVVGAEARVAFVVHPPWYRTPLAWFIYVLGSVGFVAVAAWLPAVLQRREKARLERLVARRTEELHATNLQLERQIAETTDKSTALAASEERFRTLNAELEQRVEERTAELSRSNLELQQRERLFRLMFEHAPVGISWKRADLDNVYHINPTFRRILQLPSDVLSDYSLIAGLVHPDDLVHLHRMMQLVASGEIDSYSVEIRFVVPDGGTLWGSLSVAVVRTEAGQVLQDIGILEDITARKHAEEQLATTYKNLVDASRVAGMAEVATGVLHNVGNVLNSLNVSSNLIAASLRQSKADSFARLSTLIDEHASDLGQFLAHDPKGKLVPQLFAKLAQNAVAERDWLLQEIGSVQKNIDHIKEIVAMQQSYATVIGVVETLDPTTLFEDALRMNSAALQRHDVHVLRHFQQVPPVAVEKGKVLQILTNLIRNAKYACDDAQQQHGLREKTITLGLEAVPGGRVRLTVSDNGIGIPSENLTRIFSHGFTTRSYGHGFGLHASALAAQEMKGSLSARSDGLGQGATFVLEIPTAPASALGSAAHPADGGGSRPPMPTVGWR